jgi:hypothetical protein
VKALGTNQRIGVLGGGLPLLGVFALVLGGYVPGEAFVELLPVYVTPWVLAMLAPSAYIKTRATASKEPAP